MLKIIDSFCRSLTSSPRTSTASTKAQIVTVVTDWPLPGQASINGASRPVRAPIPRHLSRPDRRASKRERAVANPGSTWTFGVLS